VTKWGKSLMTAISACGGKRSLASNKSQKARSNDWAFFIKRSVKPIGHEVPMGRKRPHLHLYFVNLNRYFVLSK